ncbi:prolyl oligopeptidase family serine peptidase [Flavobacterium sp. SH_e]|uniref:alpha/beta hydrolase family protein n=1 Tax=Flavobacterium TaxID=237 RepID=UPI0021E3E9F0|nr:prolyl oligopeptidase family serine peptidase [Flavobacterium sp. SH_e]MCV2484343.1 prolyl oligopeptidase family serine peptidase [Flavobacterium sp. SH_e]
MSKAIFTDSCRTAVLTAVPILEFLFLLFILPLVACPLWGQAMQKKHLSPADYSRWGEVHLDKISSDEKWAAYRMAYENGADTLFIQNIKTGQRHFFTDAEKTLFTQSNFFICSTGSDLTILDLETLKTETVSGIQKYAYDKQTDQLIILLDSPEEKGMLHIRSPKKAEGTAFKNVSQFALSPNGAMLAFTVLSSSEASAAVLSLLQPKKAKWISAKNAERLAGLIWEKEGRALAFLKESADQKIKALGLYIPAEDRMYELEPDSCTDFPNHSSIFYDAFSPIVISSDLKRVFFSIQNEAETAENISKSDVQIWNANDKWVYSQHKTFESFDKMPKIAVWNPAGNHVHQITTNELPLLMLTDDMKYAVLSDPSRHQPQFEAQDVRDFYVMDLTTFEKKMLLEKHVYLPWALNPSSSGKYFAYFRDNSWWVYEFATGIHKNVSEKIGVKFSGKVQELVPESTYGNPGWSLDDREILLYDQFDIWAVSPSGSTSRRLTKGRELGIKLRIAPQPNRLGAKHLYDGPVADSFDLRQELLLRGSGRDGKTGYFRWNSTSGEKAVTYGDYYSDELNYAPKKKTLFFREQQFDSPPELFSSTGTQGKKSFFKSNPHHKGYFWGKSELIEFKNMEGRSLKGVLFYPADYDPKIKYPMIVHIYELKSHELHIYDNPTYQNGTGFNITLANAEGYFVFLPDIQHEYQKPGISAADCVISGVKKIIEKGIVNEHKIGLIGHSFGGFESAFIMSQTDLFAAGIASGAITDLFSHYNSIGPRAGDPEQWRYSGEQFNMGGSPYEIPKLYEANSPIIHAPKITAPMLLWTGDRDPQVDPHQSYELYLALRWLRKKSIMLVYPKAGHVLIDPSQQKDITIRTLEWFSYHLKGNHNYPWIANGME